MLELTTPGILETFFARLAVAPHRVLMLDYDGTLAPFREERDEAIPYPGVREALAAIREETGTRLVVISGRAVRDLLPLLGLDPPPEVFGSHGWEHLPPGGEAVHVFDLDAATATALEMARTWIEREGHAARSERKPASVTLHWRGLPPAEQQRLETDAQRAWMPLTTRAQVELHAFDGGVEIRARGRNKGDAARAILEEVGTEAAAAYLGDDLTDEDAFAALGPRALKVLVREQPRDTLADLWLRPPEQLLQFLTLWKQEGRTHHGH